MRHPRGTLATLGLLAGLIGTLVVLVGCGAAATTSATTGATTGSGTTTAPKATPTATATAVPQQAKVGDTLLLNGVEVTLVSATALQPGQFDSLKQGDIYVVCHVKIVDTGTSEASYNEFDFQLLSGTGNLTNTTYASAYTANAGLQSGSLTPGGSVEGDLVFEVAQGDHAAKLTWQPVFGGPQSINNWLLGL